jgi:uncharacterized protein
LRCTDRPACDKDDARSPRPPSACAPLGQRLPGPCHAWTTSGITREVVPTLTVAALWRYPVKSLAGEPLSSADIRLNGIPGDRIVWVRGPEGVRTSRRHHRLLGLRGSVDEWGDALVNGHPWHSDEALALVRAAAGDDAWLEEADEPRRFDILPLLVATDGAVAVFGRDVRRLRPNILIGGVDGLDERSWPGAELHIGDVHIRLDSLRGRCPMTTVDPETLERDPEVLKDIGRRFAGRLALNAAVLRPGRTEVGAAAHLRRVEHPQPA